MSIRRNSKREPDTQIWISVDERNELNRPGGPWISGIVDIASSCCEFCDTKFDRKGDVSHVAQVRILFGSSIVLLALLTDNSALAIGYRECVHSTSCHWHAVRQCRTGCPSTLIAIRLAPLDLKAQAILCLKVFDGSSIFNAELPRKFWLEMLGCN